MSKVVNIQLL